MSKAKSTSVFTSAPRAQLQSVLPDWNNPITGKPNHTLSADSKDPTLRTHTFSTSRVVATRSGTGFHEPEGRGKEGI